MLRVQIAKKIIKTNYDGEKMYTRYFAKKKLPVFLSPKKKETGKIYTRYFKKKKIASFFYHKKKKTLVLDVPSAPIGSLFLRFFSDFCQKF